MNDLICFDTGNSKESHLIREGDQDSLIIPKSLIVTLNSLDEEEIFNQIFKILHKANPVHVNISYSLEGHNMGKYYVLELPDDNFSSDKLKNQKIILLGDEGSIKPLDLQMAKSGGEVSIPLYDGTLIGKLRVKAGKLYFVILDYVRCKFSVRNLSRAKLADNKTMLDMSKYNKLDESVRCSISWYSDKKQEFINIGRVQDVSGGGFSFFVRQTQSLRFFREREKSNIPFKLRIDFLDGQPEKELYVTNVKVFEGQGFARIGVQFVDNSMDFQNKVNDFVRAKQVNIIRKMRGLSILKDKK